MYGLAIGISCTRASHLPLRVQPCWGKLGVVARGPMTPPQPRMEYLNALVDDSDPDTDFSQLQHLLQTAEAIRTDGHPNWFVLAGLIHDLGKVLCLFGEPQWAVVGDTYPVGCAYSDKVVYPEYFQQNPEYRDPAYQTRLGVYAEGCGLDKVHLSWGHDEYIYNVVKATCRKRGSPCSATTPSTRRTGRGRTST